MIKNTQQRLKEAVEEAKYIAWASVQIFRSKLWGEQDENGKIVKVVPAVWHQALPAVGFIAHVYAQRPGGGVHCMRCNRWARTTHSKRHLVNAACKASPLRQMRALLATQAATDDDIELVGVTEAPSDSSAVNVALQVADRFQEERLAAHKYLTSKISLTSNIYLI